MFHFRMPAFLLLSAAVSIAGAGVVAADVTAEPSDRAPVFELHDADGELRRGLGEQAAAERLAWLRANVRTAHTLEQTVERAVAAGLRLSWEAVGSDGPGGSSGQAELDDPSVGEWVALAAAQVAMDRFPEAAAGLSSPILDPRDDSPVCDCFVERIHRCPGCSAVNTGPNACDFSLQCNSPMGHGCMSIEIQRCIASHAIQILFPLPR